MKFMSPSEDLNQAALAATTRRRHRSIGVFPYLMDARSAFKLCLIASVGGMYWAGDGQETDLQVRRPISLCGPDGRLHIAAVRRGRWDNAPPSKRNQPDPGDRTRKVSAEAVHIQSTELRLCFHPATATGKGHRGSEQEHSLRPNRRGLVPCSDLVLVAGLGRLDRERSPRLDLGTDCGHQIGTHAASAGCLSSSR